MEEVRKILVIRLKSIGDIVFTLPAVHVIRAAHPNAQITFLVSQEHAALLEGFEEVNSTIQVDRARFRGLHPYRTISEAVTLWRSLRAERFSVVIDFQGYGETGLLTWCTGASKRWGTVYRAARRWAYTHGVRRRPGQHPAESHLELLKDCGLPASAPRNEFKLPAAAADSAKVFFAKQTLDPRRATLFIQPFTSSRPKDWPLEGYLELGRQWLSEGKQVLFGGGPDDRAALAPATQAGFPVSAGTPLLVTAGLMKLSSVVLGGDTGMLHLAVALGKRVVMTMRGTGPGSCYPFQHRDWAVTPAAGRPVAAIGLDTIRQACARALTEQESATGGISLQGER